MADDEPLVKLTYAILLSALKRRAEAVRIDGDHPQGCAVRFWIDGVEQVEMCPPIQLRAPLIRRLSAMADLPSYPKDGAAEGEFTLLIGEHRHARFAVRVEGRAFDLVATLHILQGLES